MILMNIIIFLLSFVGMEAVAWLAHKYLMHGWLWKLHEDHHYKGEDRFFEKNDYFFLIFATPGIILLLIGTWQGLSLPYFWIGAGIAVYGFCYFLVHDVFIHQRFPWLRNAHSIYFRAIRKAHKVHHKHLGKEDGECFGMLWVPLKYFREARKSQALNKSTE
jgi:beta-carotene 3-hydroxylase